MSWVRAPLVAFYLDKNMYGYIYLTINKVNHKTYVGQKMLKNKNWNKDNYLGSGKHLKCAIKKYGKENFEKFLIQFCNTKEELDKQEIFWIAEYRKRGLAQYNIANGGEGGGSFKGRHHSGETKRKISEVQKGKPKYGLRGKKLSEEHKQKLSESHKGNQNHKGKYHSEETKRRISKAKKGVKLPPLSEEAKRKISESKKGDKNPMYGKHLSDEAKKNLSQSSKGRHFYNNGKVNVFVKECPPGFIPGILYHNK